MRSGLGFGYEVIVAYGNACWLVSLVRSTSYKGDRTLVKRSDIHSLHVVGTFDFALDVVALAEERVPVVQDLLVLV